jgi:hypothetical protein
MAQFIFTKLDNDLMPEDFQLGSVGELIGENAADGTPIIQRGGKRNRSVAECEEQKSAVGAVCVAPEDLLLEKVLVLGDPFSGFRPFQPDSPDGRCLW